MQLDKTLIVIRERGVFDTLDLALQVFRRHLPPLLLALALLAVPCALLNHWAIGWMVVTDPDAPLLEDQVPGLIRFTWTMILLVTLEAPLATSLVTTYLGKAVFQEAPLLREILRESRAPLAQVVFCHLLLRGVLPAFLLVFLVDRAQGFAFPELLLALLVLAVLVRRLVAPFLNEVVLLEKNPLRARHPGGHDGCQAKLGPARSKSRGADQSRSCGGNRGRASDTGHVRHLLVRQRDLSWTTGPWVRGCLCWLGRFPCG